MASRCPDSTRPLRRLISNADSCRLLPAKGANFDRVFQRFPSVSTPVGRLSGAVTRSTSDPMNQPSGGRVERARRSLLFLLLVHQCVGLSNEVV